MFVNYNSNYTSASHLVQDLEHSLGLVLELLPPLLHHLPDTALVARLNTPVVTQ